jgi:predicted RND superfamily exporter protein
MSGQQENLVSRLADFLIRWRWLLLLAALAAIIAAWPVAKHLSLDQSIESLYAEDDGHLLNYRESRQLFGGDEFVLVAYTDPDLFNDENSALSEQGEATIRQLADRLNQVPGVNAASTQNLAESLEFRFRRSRTRELVRGVLLGADDETTTIVVRLKAGLSDLQRAQTIKEIREIAAARETRTYVAGEPVQVHDMFRYVQEDGKLLFTVSLGLLACVIIVFFRSVRWVILPLLVVLAAIVWTEAVLVLSGIRLSMVSSMLNSLVTIIGIATVTHVTVRYRECRRTLDRPDATAISPERSRPIGIRDPGERRSSGVPTAPRHP